MKLCDIKNLPNLSEWSVKILEHATSVGQVAGLFSSQQAVLARAGLGTQRRTDLLKQLSYSGPAEIRSFAAIAVLTKDLTLGAAIQSINDRTKVQDRALSSAELAASLVAEEVEIIQSALVRVMEGRNEQG